MKTKPRPNNLAFLHRDRGYRFKDRDPVLEEICAMITSSGKTSREISELTAKASGGAHKISHTTMDNWLNGKVKKPQNFAVTWIGYVLGWKRVWAPINSPLRLVLRPTVQKDA